MKILVVSQYYYPEQFRITDICESLVKKGHQVTVLTGMPNYPQGELFIGYEKNDKLYEYINGVTVLRCKCRPRHKGLFNLFLNYLSFVIKGTKLSKKIKCNFDIVYVYSVSPITLAIPAIHYSKKHNLPLYLYCMDLWPESIRQISDDIILGLHNPIFLLVKFVSKKIYSKADLIGVKCKQFGNYLTEICKVNPNKIRLLYEHAETIYLDVNPLPKENDCYDFMFLGNIGSIQNCEMILHATSKIDTHLPFKVHFVGDGSNIDSLKALSKELELGDKVVFHGKVDIKRTISFYNICDCCLSTLSSTTDVGLTPPGKLYSYMASCRPIISMAAGESINIVNDSKCGINVKPEDFEDLAIKMKWAIENKDCFQEYGNNGRKYFLEHFTVEKHVKYLCTQLDEILKE